MFYKFTTVVCGGCRRVIALPLLYIVTVNFISLIVLYLEITRVFFAVGHLVSTYRALGKLLKPFYDLWVIY